MVHNKGFDSNGSVHDSAGEGPALRSSFSGKNNTTACEMNARDLNSRELLTRLDLIRGFYKSDTSQHGRKQYRNEARMIKLALVKNSRKKSYLAGSLVLGFVLLLIFLQNIGVLL